MTGHSQQTSSASSTFDLRVDGVEAYFVFTGDIDSTLVESFTISTLNLPANLELVVLDATAVTFIDSRAVRVLIDLAKRFSGRVVILDPPPTLKFLLEVTAVADLVSIVDGATFEATAR